MSHFANTALMEPRSGATVRLHQLMEERQRIEIGQRIKELRNASPYTNEAIADHVGVRARSVANWIAGTTGIDYEHAQAVADLFGVDVVWLWSGRDAGPIPDLSERLAELETKVDRLLDFWAAEQASALVDQARPQADQQKRRSARTRRKSG